MDGLRHFLHCEYFGSLGKQVASQLTFLCWSVSGSTFGIFFLQHSYWTWDRGLESLSKLEWVTQDMPEHVFISALLRSCKSNLFATAIPTEIAQTRLLKTWGKAFKSKNHCFISLCLRVIRANPSKDSTF